MPATFRCSPSPASSFRRWTFAADKSPLVVVVRGSALDKTSSDALEKLDKSSQWKHVVLMVGRAFDRHFIER